MVSSDATKAMRLAHHSPLTLLINIRKTTSRKDAKAQEKCLPLIFAPLRLCVRLSFHDLTPRLRAARFLPFNLEERNGLDAILDRNRLARDKLVAAAGGARRRIAQENLAAFRV